MRALVVKSPWIELILSGEKIWEVRSRASRLRERIALIKSQSGKVFGTVEIVACHGAFTREEIAQHQDKHRVPPELMHVVDYKRFYGWELRRPVLFGDPVSYNHPSGAVTWVTLTDENVPLGIQALQSGGLASATPT